MRIFPRKSLCSFGFLVVIIFGFCIVLGAVAAKPGSGKSKGKGPACGTNVMSQISSSSASSSSGSPSPQNEPQQEVCIEANQGDNSQIVIEEVDGTIFKDIILEDSPQVIYDKFLNAMDSVKINVDEIINNKFEDDLNLEDNLQRIYNNFFSAMDRIKAYVDEIINTYLFENANLHDESNYLKIEIKNLFVDNKDITNSRDKLKVMYEKLVRSIQTNEDHLQENKVHLVDCQTKLASLGKNNKACQIKLILYARLATETKVRMEDCETKLMPITNQITTLTKQLINVQKEFQIKENKITILNKDYRKKVDLLKEQYNQDVESFQQQHDKSRKVFEDIQLQVDLRQLFNDFRQVSTIGVFIDKFQLLKWAKTCRDDEIKTRNELRQITPIYKETLDQYLLADLHWMITTKTFSALVISLYNDKMNLKKYKDDPSTSLKEQSITQFKITKRNDQVKALKKVAASYKPSRDADGDASGMTWSEAIGEGYVQWCILVAEANKACHPDLTDEEILNNIRTRAEQGIIVHKGRQMKEVVIAVIDEIRSNVELSSE